MRTSVYIDGFNLYYGALKGTPYKWLDLKVLLGHILPKHLQITRIKYFTALVDGSRDPQQPIRQKTYLRALEATIPEIKIYYGHFLTHVVTMPLAHPTPTQKRAEVLKTEEKGSDVNLAIHLLNDSWLDRYDCAVLVSNDSDLATALQIVTQHHQKEVGLVQAHPRHRTSRQLQQYARFVRPIRTGVLSASQLPDLIPGTNLHKPVSW